MSFDMKYNKNGDPIKPTTEPIFEEKQPLPQPEQPPVVESIEPQDVVLQPVVPAQAAAEVSEETIPQTEPIVEKPKKDPKQSWREMRDETLRLSRERDEALRERDEALRSIQSPQQQQAIPENESAGIGDTDIAEGRHLNALKKEISDLKKELKNFHKQTSEITAEQRILQKYPDFYKVVTKDNAQLLRELEPELASSLYKDTDIYNQSIGAYKAIKKAGIYQEDTYEPDRTKVMQNAAKPRPLSSLSPQQGDSPLSHANAFANGLTDDLKSKLLKEMAEAIRNR